MRRQRQRLTGEAVFEVRRGRGSAMRTSCTYRCMGCVAVLALVVALLYAIELENWRKGEFVVYVRGSYGRMYVKRYGRLPTSLQDFVTLTRQDKIGMDGPGALALETYRMYRPRMSSVQVSQDGRRVDAFIRFDGYFPRKQAVAITDLQ